MILVLVAFALQIPLALLAIFAYFGRRFFTELDDQCRLAFRKLERWGK